MGRVTGINPAALQRMRDAGLQVDPQPGWVTRGRSPLTPHGIVIHHTAGPATGDTPSLPVVTHGRAATATTRALPGPLYNVLVGRTGIVRIIAAQTANHAGTGSWRGLAGNHTVIGVAAENTGLGEPWGVTQYRATVRACAVLCLTHNIPTSLVCGHKEWTPRKPDPAGIDMDRLRVDVFAATLDIDGTATLPPLAPAPPKEPTVDPVRQAQAAINAWLPPERRIAVDGRWGPASTAALTRVLDQVAAPQIRRVAELEATVTALRQQQTANQFSDPNLTTPNAAALAVIGAETARWVETVTNEIAKLTR
jgi:hypothetical protein